MTTQLRKDLMTARDARVKTNKAACLTIAIERVNRGDLKGAALAVQAAHQCDIDGGFIPANHEESLGPKRPAGWTHFSKPRSRIDRTGDLDGRRIRNFLD